MKKLVFLLTIALCSLPAFSAGTAGERHRILISTDIGGTDPDDNQSMTHLLMYANEFDIEGLVSSPSFGDGSKEEILRMISMYELDLPALEAGLRNSYGDSHGSFPSPGYLRSIARQGRKDGAPLCGYGEATEGSEWIVECARKDDPRPLWVLVWGALEDVAQALHDAPDIADRIRVYWIGGPNKKWGSNAYSYIARNFPSLWFIENNATYRGFIGSSADKSLYQSGFWPKFMKDAGTMGNDFINYYDGIVKMGDTPSLLYLMSGDPDRPDSEHWGGRFEPIASTPCYTVTGPLSASDTVPCYSLMEWKLAGPDIEVSPDSACFVLTVDRQQWPGYYAGDGTYVVRYSPKAPATLPYTITSDIPGFPAHEGCFAVGGRWPVAEGYVSENPAIEYCPIALGAPDGSSASTWFTDVQDYSSKWQGSPTIARWRADIMKDWGARFKWLKADDSRDWMLGRTWANGFTALPDDCTDLDEFQSQYQLNKAQWDAAFGWLATHDLTGLPAGKYPVEGTELTVSIQDSDNEPLAKRKSESHREHIDLQYVVKGTERFALLDHESSTPNSEWRRDVIHYDYDPDKATFIDSTPGRFFLFFPNDWHIAKIATDNDDQSIRVVVIKLDYISTNSTPRP